MEVIKQETIRLLGIFGFEVEVKYYGYKVAFDVYEITGAVPDTGEIVQKELYLKGKIKWDTCSHFWFGEGESDNPGYMHLCGYGDFIKHAKLMELLWNTAKKYFQSQPERFTDEFEDWKWEDVDNYGKENEFDAVDVNGITKIIEYEGEAGIISTTIPKPKMEVIDEGKKSDAG